MRLVMQIVGFLCIIMISLSNAEARKNGPPADPPEKSGSPEKGKVSESLEVLAESLHGDLKAAKQFGKSLAVMPFAENGKTAKEKGLGSAAAGELHVKLAALGWSMVERQRLGDLFREMEMEQAGLIEDGKAADLAGLAGADVLIVGSVSEVGDRYMINVRAVSKETGRAIAARSTEVPASYLIALSSEAVVLRTRWDSTYRSMVAPGWGQFYNSQPAKAWVFIGTELLLVGATLGFHFGGEMVQSEYDDLTAEDFRKGKDDELNDKKTTLDYAKWTSVGAIALVYVINVIDAAINGKTYERTESGEVVGPGSAGGSWSPALFGDPENPAAGMNLEYRF